MCLSIIIDGVTWDRQTAVIFRITCLRGKVWSLLIVCSISAISIVYWLSKSVINTHLRCQQNIVKHNIYCLLKAHLHDYLDTITINQYLSHKHPNFRWRDLPCFYAHLYAQNHHCVLRLVRDFICCVTLNFKNYWWGAEKRWGNL